MNYMHSDCKGITRRSILWTPVMWAGLPRAVAQTGITPKRDIDLQRLFPAGAPLPKWENGFFVGVDSIYAAIPQIYANEADGSKLFEVPLRFEQTVRVMTRDYASSRGGVFAVAGSAYSNLGDGALFVALFNKQGQLVRVIRTGSFAASGLCFTDDGTLWAAGRVTNYPSAGEPPDHDLLHGYSSDGTLRVSLLPRSTFAKDPHRSHPAHISHLASNGREIVFLAVEHRELIGVSAGGEILYRKQFAPPVAESYSVTGFVVAPDGAIYMSCQVPLPSDKKRSAVAYYRWDGRMNQWKEVYFRPLGGFDGYLAIVGAGPEGVLARSRLPKFKWLQVAL